MTVETGTGDVSPAKAPSQKNDKPVVTFEKTYGNREKSAGLSMQKTPDGGYVLFGWTRSFGEGADEGDMYLIKTDELGNVIWEQTFGGDGWEDGYSVAATDDGGYVMLGSTKSFGAGGADMYLIKVDAGGNKLWEKTFGGPKDENARDVKQTSDGGYILIGYTKSFGAGMADMYAVKTDKDGNEMKARTFGGTGNDWGRSVMETSDGSYLLLGTTPGTHNDIFLVKTDCCGNTLWEKRYDGLGKDKGMYVTEGFDGGYIILGNSISYGKPHADIYIIMTDKDGNEIRSGKIGGSHEDWGYSVKQIAADRFIVFGSTKSFSEGDSDFYLVKLILDGDDFHKIFEKTFGGDKSDVGWAAAVADDGGYALFGWTSSFGNDRGEMYFVKTDSDGEV
jgi:hypothetical protein